jgi:hypothetical protein
VAFLGQPEQKTATPIVPPSRGAIGVSKLSDEYRKTAAFCREQAERTNLPEMKVEWMRLARMWLALMPRKDPGDEPPDDPA